MKKWRFQLLNRRILVGSMSKIVKDKERFEYGQ